jgi:transposase
MGKPYSLDLRKRVVAAIEGGMSRNQAAKQFGVAISTAIGWMQRVDETGSVAPGQMGGHKPKAISGEHAAWLSQRIKSDDFTLRGLVAELAGRGLKVDYHSVWDFVHAEKLSFKKKRGGWRTRSSRRGAAPAVPEPRCDVKNQPCAHGRDDWSLPGATRTARSCGAANSRSRRCQRVMSPVGTFRTSRPGLTMSVHRGEADSPRTALHFRV